MSLETKQLHALSRIYKEAVYGGAKKEAPKDTRMVVTNADKKANTKAYQNMKAGVKGYKAADHMKNEEKMAKKDYDGDGKVESSKYEYFGSKDKAIKKAMGKKIKEGMSNWRHDLKEIPDYDQIPVDSKKSNEKITEKKVKNTVKINPNLPEGYGSKKKKKHDCASKVKHEEFGIGDCISEAHDLDENGNVAHYDVEFEKYIVKNVPVGELEILEGEMHEHVIHEKHSADTKGKKNCGCGQNPCVTYGKQEDVKEGVYEKKKIDVKKGIKDKVNINPNLPEAVQEMGAELIEVKVEKKKGKAEFSSKAKGHDCASKVKHESYGVGDCIKEQHDLDENGNVTHYDVKFSNRIVRNVPASTLEVLEGMYHEHVIREKESYDTVAAVIDYDRSKKGTDDAVKDSEEGKKKAAKKERDYAAFERKKMKKDDPNWEHKRGSTSENYQAMRNPEKAEKEDKRSAREKRMADPKKGINSPAFKEFMRQQGM